MSLANPYNFNLPVTPEMFFGRQNDVATLMHHLLATPGDSFALIGGRRIGKTSLLEALLRALTERAVDPNRPILPIPVFLDLTGEPIDSVEAFFDLVCVRAHEVLMTLGFPVVTNIVPGQERDHAIRVFQRMLQQWEQIGLRHQGCRVRLILVLDECEQIVERPWTPTLYAALRSILVGQETRALCKVVMAGSHRFLTQVHANGSPLRNVLRHHVLYAFNRQVTYDLIIQPTRGVLSAEVVAAIARESGGHFFLVQYLMHYLWEHGLAQVTFELIHRIVAQFSEERRDFLDWADSLGDEVLQVYQLLVQSRTPLTFTDVQAALHQPFPRLPQALQALRYHGLITQEEDGRRYHIAGDMFQKWFVRHVAERREQSTPPQHLEKRMSTCTWLHISDIHFRTAQTFETNIVLEALLQDVEERVQQDNLRPDFIVVTGDIAHAGQVDEYALARQFFDALLATVGLSREQLLIISGNHDVDRRLISQGSHLIGNALADRNKTNALLATPEDRRGMFSRFAAYAAFINDYLSGFQQFDEAQYFYVRTLEVAGRRLAVLGLNSAWVCASNEDQSRKILLGERQVRAALQQAQDAEIKIALLHHPFDWLRDFDRQDSEPLLLNRCHFVLHGHLHRAGLTQPRSPDSSAMVIAGGACYDTREHPNLYNFVQLDFTAATGTMYLRRYSNESGGFWTKDVQTYRNVPDGVYTFTLPHLQ